MTLHDSTMTTLDALKTLLMANLEMQKALGLVLSALAMKEGGELRIQQEELRAVAESGQWALCLKQDDETLVLRIASKDRVAEFQQDYKVVQLS